MKDLTKANPRIVKAIDACLAARQRCKVKRRCKACANLTLLTALRIEKLLSEAR